MTLSNTFPHSYTDSRKHITFMNFNIYTNPSINTLLNNSDHKPQCSVIIWDVIPNQITSVVKIAQFFDSAKIVHF